MNNDIAYVFNGTQFISVRKNEMLNELIDTHIKEINLSLEKNKNKLNEQYVTRLEKFLDMLNDDDTKFTDHNNKRTYNSYKAYKINAIKLLIYNASDKKKLDLLNNTDLQEKSVEDSDSDYDSEPN
jgi:mRNA-degrading endonuclease YafQ of YafQ-DinJ toxin-antitoxin module